MHYLYTDGASRGNPGLAGAGFVIFNENGEEIFAGKKFLGTATNNVAEHIALQLGIEKAIELNIKELICRLDSELAVKQFTGEYRVKHPDLKPIYEKSCTLLKNLEFVKFEHVRREKNKRADELANESIDLRKI